MEDSDPILLSQTALWVDCILPFLGPGHYFFVAGTNKRLKELYQDYFERLTNNPSADLTTKKELRRIRFTTAQTYPVPARQTYYSAAFGNSMVFDAWNHWFKSRRLALEILCDMHHPMHDLLRTAIRDQIAISGSVELARWAGGKLPLWTERVCKRAASLGHLEFLKYARADGCPWHKTTINEAAASGHLEIVEWAHFNGCPWDETTCSASATGGNVDVLAFAHEHGCPWDVHTCRNASEEGKLLVLKYAHENGCPWDAESAALAAKRGHVQTLKYLHENGCPEAEQYLAEALKHSGEA